MVRDEVLMLQFNVVTGGRLRARRLRWMRLKRLEHVLQKLPMGSGGSPEATFN